jgi:nicotinate-nucleotide adenylyltransferase
MIGILGGAFDPPHNGHVALAREGKRRFALERLVVLVADAPGHKRVEAPGVTRLRLARAAFPGDEVVLDRHARTVDAVAGGRFGEAIFLIGADQFEDFLDWKDPDGVLEQVRLGVATRPGYPRGPVESVLARLGQPERVEFFELEDVPVASRDVRERIARGEPVDDLVPAAVAALIGELGLYRAS